MYSLLYEDVSMPVYWSKLIWFVVLAMRFGHAMLPDLNDSAQTSQSGAASSMNAVEEANHVYVPHPAYFTFKEDYAETQISTLLESSCVINFF